MAAPLDQLAQEIVDHRFKGLPPDAAGLTVGELAAQRRDFRSGGFTTPLLTASAGALEHNVRTLAAFAERHGLALAPHGKTSMAPALFRRQLDHGAWGITVAVPHQARVARAFGVGRIFVANEVVDRAALSWLAGELDADPAFRCVVYVDSAVGVALMDAALREAGATRALDVVVEWGTPGGRTGARDAESAAAVADAVARVATLRLVGVAGYEGEVPAADATSVRAWLDQLVALAVRFDAEGRFGESEEIVVSAGGSAWFDVLAASFAELPALSRPVLPMLRAGAYVSHDHGRYRQVTPFGRVPDEGGLRPAFLLWAQVVSRPEPGLALLNAGKRDIAHDLDLPEVVEVRAVDGAARATDGLTVARLADQHAFLVAGDGAEAPAVGEWVALGMSHPCTIFDKWPMIPVVDDEGAVVELLRTFF